ncbi:hypothetical protein GCM10023231_31820 [Olivibacter ginsenosidimutans]|uniref:BD-FAE-like domain-containing protein n=1 Tax=Olivibacter ginsenosidimutans TaxID=1176537 RepID=A0ABP9BZ51_9SPHI
MQTKTIKAFCVTVMLVAFVFCHAQKQIPLYENKIPNSKPASNRERKEANEQVDTLVYRVSIPDLTVFQPPPDKANGTAVIICPGGGYHVLLFKREGSDIAKALAEHGVTAFVLKYRLPDEEIMVDKAIGPLQDAQQAIRIVREGAARWGINPRRIGMMGFSAGGHLAATAGTHFGKAYVNHPEQISLRPDFLLLINPVISMTDSIGHVGSRNCLLGANPPSEQIRLFSNELHINAQTPPTFLVHAVTDEVVPVENSLSFYQALRKYHVAVGLHIYAKGEHGFLSAPPFKEWFGRCIYWMEAQNLLQR